MTAGPIELAALEEVTASVTGLRRPRLILEGVRKTWHRAPQPVLDGVDLELRAGTATWIGGRNGIGKTTLLRIIAGVLKPEEGRLDLLGLNPERQRRRYQREIGLLTADGAGLHARLTVRRHLDLWTRLTFIPKPERPQAIAWAIEQWALDDLLDKRVDRMSMGQRQRLRLALAFLHNPTLVLLDEPRNSLDTEGVQLVTAAVQEHVDSGGVVLCCAPAGEDPIVEYHAHYAMEAGRLVAQ
jgi:ABC-2 type transport system ATP-binding protein